MTCMTWFCKKKSLCHVVCISIFGCAQILSPLIINAEESAKTSENWKNGTNLRLLSVVLMISTSDQQAALPTRCDKFINSGEDITLGSPCSSNSLVLPINPLTSQVGLSPSFRLRCSETRAKIPLNPNWSHLKSSCLGCSLKREKKATQCSCQKEL